jgi:serine/threonine protein kinase
MSNIERLKELADLHEKGLITREQFDRERDMLLGRVSGAGALSGTVIPETVGAYNILGMIGRGGMGTVFKARHRSEEVARRQGGDVAIKVMHPHLATNKRFQERFEREAALGLKLDHPGIIGVYDLVVDGGTLALVMELAEGRTLSQLVGRETGPLPWERARPMFDQLLAAVAAAHAAGVIHRDLKPENVIIGSDGRLRVADFGIAKELGTERTRTGTGLGTAGYMAPEQYRDAGKVDQRADIYALGMTLYEMLAGRLPWEPDTSEFEVLQVKATGDVPPPTDYYPDIPPAVVAALMKAVSVDVDLRPESVEAFAASLEGPKAERVSLAKPSEPAERSAPAAPPVGQPAAVPPRGAAARPGVLGSAPPPKKGSKAPLFIALGLGCMVVCGFGGGIALLVLVAINAEKKEAYEDDWSTWSDPTLATPFPAPSGPTALPAAPTDGVGTMIRALSDEGGSSAWDAAVKPILVSAYDSNGSGLLDTAGEVGSLPCSTWHALDDGVLERWDYGLRTIYGFEASYSWVGYALGFDEAVRPTADSFLAGCQAAGWPAAGGGTVVGGLGSSGSASGTAGRIRGLSQEGGSSDWDNAVKPIMVSAFDGDGSGLIDGDSEARSVPCDVWDALDDGVKQTYSSGLRSTYGFESGFSWLGHVIGIDESVRATSDAALQSCASGGGLTGSTVGGGTVGASTTGSGVGARIRGLSEEGGSTGWDSAVKPIIVGAFDTNGSGFVDTTAESAAIPCDTWRALDEGVKAKWSYGIRVIYGFQGGGWLGNLVGFGESIRSTSDSHASNCGLGTDSGEAASANPAPGDGVGAKIRGRSEEGGSDPWDAAVKPIMVAAYDLNGSGTLDTQAEVSTVSCAAWKALDDGVKVKWGYGIRTIYGFKADMSWVGYAVGFSESVRASADSGAAACGLE